jgi:hypothetical protein
MLLDVGALELESVTEDGEVLQVLLHPLAKGLPLGAEAVEVPLVNVLGLHNEGLLGLDAPRAHPGDVRGVHELTHKLKLELRAAEGVNAAVWLMEHAGVLHGVLKVELGWHFWGTEPS